MENNNTLVIIHSGGDTCALLNGKFIGRGIERISFDVVAGQHAKLDIGSVDLNRAEFGTMEEFQATALRLGFEIRQK